jgi:CDP-diacylglycerol---serine O-phosphatidyltransferase
MRRIKNERTDRFKQRLGRRKRLRYITILPSLVTIINCLCGFASIVFASNGQFSIAGYMIILAMIADAMDGRLARKVDGVSSFGVQLDSLCDVISFGVAPAFLMLKVLQPPELTLESSLLHIDNLIGRFIWVAAAAYTCCAVIRLARFNVENPDEKSDHSRFVGLPSPAAAGVIVSLILLQTHIRQSTIPGLIIIKSLPFIAFGVAILMVSRVPYPHILNQFLIGKKPLANFIGILLLLVFVIWFLQIALVVIFCGFAADSFFRWLYYRLRVRHKLVIAGQQDSQEQLKPL